MRGVDLDCAVGAEGLDIGAGAIDSLHFVMEVSGS